MLIYLNVSKYAIDTLSLSFHIENKFNFLEYFQGNSTLNMINPGFRLMQFCIERKRPKINQAVILHSAWNCYSCNILLVIPLMLLERFSFTDITPTVRLHHLILWHLSPSTRAFLGTTVSEKNSCKENNTM